MAGTYSIWGGIAWVYLYFDQENKPKFQFFKPYEVLPFWNDAEHTDLDCAARVYLVEGYEGGVPKVWHKCEIFTHNGISRFDLDGATLTAGVDNPGGYYARQGDENFRFKDGKIPLIPLKFNYYEQPLISRVKGLQDAYNQILSSFADRTEEDIHSTILVIKNYDGEDLAGFRQNLATYGAIKVRSVNGEADSGVDTLRIEVNTENFQVVLQCLKKAIIENGRGYDAKDDRIGSNANQMNIKSMYMDIDLDASLMQTASRRHSRKSFASSASAEVWHTSPFASRSTETRSSTPRKSSSCFRDSASECPIARYSASCRSSRMSTKKNSDSRRRMTNWRSTRMDFLHKTLPGAE